MTPPPTPTGTGADASTSQGPPPAPTYSPQIYNGTLPNPIAEVAKCFQTIPEATQIKDANTFLTFLQDPDSNPLELNMDNSLRAVLLNVPKSSRIKLLFCGGVGASGIGKTSPIDNKFVWLEGDGGTDVGAPSSLTIPLTAKEVNKVTCMSDAVFEQRLQDKGGTQYTWPLATSRNNITTTEDIMQIAPFPPCLAYDGFLDDLDAAELLERILVSPHRNNEALQHAACFLRCCLFSHNAGDNKPYVEPEHLLAPPSREAKLWAAGKFKSCFPSLSTTPTPPAQQPPPTQNLQKIIGGLRY